jgi:hypothetical protein
MLTFKKLEKLEKSIIVCQIAISGMRLRQNKTAVKNQQSMMMSL